MVSALAVLGAAAVVPALDEQPLNGVIMVTTSDTPLRERPTAGAGVVAPMHVGETVTAWASAYVDECREVVKGADRYYVEEYILWYKVKTADGYQGWLPAKTLTWPPEKGAPGGP